MPWNMLKTRNWDGNCWGSKLEHWGVELPTNWRNYIMLYCNNLPFKFTTYENSQQIADPLKLGTVDKENDIKVVALPADASPIGRAPRSWFARRASPRRDLLWRPRSIIPWWATPGCSDGNWCLSDCLEGQTDGSSSLFFANDKKRSRSKTPVVSLSYLSWGDGWGQKMVDLSLKAGTWPQAIDHSSGRLKMSARSDQWACPL